MLLCPLKQLRFMYSITIFLAPLTRRDSLCVLSMSQLHFSSLSCFTDLHKPSNPGQELTAPPSSKLDAFCCWVPAASPWWFVSQELLQEFMVFQWHISVLTSAALKTCWNRCCFRNPDYSTFSQMQCPFINQWTLFQHWRLPKGGHTSSLMLICQCGSTNINGFYSICNTSNLYQES